MKRMLLTTLFALTPFVNASAQGYDNRFGIGIFAGAVKMVLGRVDHSTVDQWGGLSIKYGFSSHFALAASAGYGWVYPRDPNGSQFTPAAPFKTILMPLHVNAIYAFFPEKGVRPYLTVGGGLTQWDVRDIRGVRWTFGTGRSLRGSQINAPAIGGAGLEAFWTDNFAIDFGVRYHHLLKGDEDTIGTGDDNRAIAEFHLGMMLYFGGRKDSDGDGIADNWDADPRSPEDIDGYRDEDGAPEPDNDHDGILDARDPCPNTPEDFDGFMDEDGCPDPDNDNDHILDVNDQCPDQPEDLDGFQDEDGCPDWDNDADGIPDDRDHCPLQAETANGYEDADGCPDEKPEEKPAPMEKGASLILRGVNFKSGSAELTEESYAMLDQAFESLQANPEVEIEIRGHTDSQGATEYNQRLSEKRAEVVRQYLIVRGISPLRLRAVGYGELDPIATNATPEGRAANRRIEFVRLK